MDPDIVDAASCGLTVIFIKLSILKYANAPNIAPTLTAGKSAFLPPVSKLFILSILWPKKNIMINHPITPNAGTQRAFAKTTGSIFVESSDPNAFAPKLAAIVS